MLRATAPLALLLLSSCWLRTERELDERLETMSTHLDDYLEGGQALYDGDGDGFEQAMRAVEKGGELPGMDLGASLDALHAEAKAARQGKTRNERASRFVALSGQCAECHTSRGHSAPLGADEQPPLQAALVALAWEDEARWQAASKALRSDGAKLSEAADWAARRQALAHVVAAGR